MKKILVAFLIFLSLFSCENDSTEGFCNAPTNVNILDITVELVEIGWISLEENATYEIQIGASGFTLGEGQIYESSENPTKIAGLTGGTEYEFYIRTICTNEDESAWAQPQTFTTLPACSEITSTSVDNITQTAALISWEYQGNFPISFIIEYDEEGFTPGDGNIAETSITNIPLMNLMKGINYHYYLKAKCTGNNFGERVGPFSFSTLD